jgi:hypothetical protein
MNARLYDPKIGAFLSPDNEVSNPDNPQNYNRYSYALNNPLIYTDPSGNSIGAFLLFFGIGLAIQNTAVTWAQHGPAAGMQSLMMNGAAFAISAGVGAAFNAILPNYASGSFGDLLSRLGSAITSSFLLNMAFEGKYSGEAALGCAISTLANFGADIADNAIAGETLNEVNYNVGDDKPDPRTDDQKNADIKRAKYYNGSDQSTTDTETLTKSLNELTGVKENSKLKFTSKIAIELGYGLSEDNITVIGPNGNKVGSYVTGTKEEVILHVSPREIRGDKVIFEGSIRHEFIHIYDIFTRPDDYLESMIECSEANAYRVGADFYDSHGYYYDAKHSWMMYGKYYKLCKDPVPFNTTYEQALNYIKTIK